MNNFILSRAYAIVHIDRIRNNIKEIKKHIGEEKKLMAVIKADAYGHGFYEVAKVAVENGVDYLAVACIEEAKQIRKCGIHSPILILGATPIECVSDLFEYDIIPTVFENELPKAISDYAQKTNKSLKVHIKVDTGMGRIGFQYYGDDESGIGNIIKISQMPGIEIEGIFTHFACADEDSAMAVSRIANLAFLVHAKDFVKKSFAEYQGEEGYFQTRGCNWLKGVSVGDGDIPVDQCVAILKRAGFDGYIDIEYEGSEDCMEGLAKGLAYLRKLV